MREVKLKGGDERGGLKEEIGFGNDGRWGLSERLKGW